MRKLRNLRKVVTTKLSKITLNEEADRPEEVTMPDISMCQNKECPNNWTCYRFTAKPSEYRQPYQAYKPAKGKYQCDSHINNGKAL